jgi:hypothetical protein
MTMLRLKTRERELLADKLPDLANLAAGALVFGQFLATDFSVVVAVGGVVVWGALIAWALYFKRGAV